ncbi:MAG: hypothetical protein IJT69_05345 [Clostridia bacterium]|nr:hypothetical protein [Clostridia bacterium]
MKVAIVIILSLVLAFSGGLLIYGATLGDPLSFGSDLGDLTPPDHPDAFAHGIAEWIATQADPNDEDGYGATFLIATNPSKDPAIFAAEVDGWYDVFGENDPSTSVLTRYTGGDLVANLIVPITYNQNRSTQFCMTSHYEITAGDYKVYSDNMRVRTQVAPFAVDAFYLSRAWAGSSTSSSAALRVYYDTQKLEYVMIFGAVNDYDEITGEYDLKIGKPKEYSRNRDLDREVPYKTYDLLNLPIYLGGKDKYDTSPVDGSVVDDRSVKVEAPTAAKPYYTLTFSENMETAQISENVNGRLNAALGEKMKNITMKKADFVVEIWECGLLRQVTAEIDVNAKIEQQGDAHITMSYKFYYDDDSCNILSLIDSVGWTQYLHEMPALDRSKNKK